MAILSELQGANGKLEDLRAILRVGRLGLLPDDMSVEDGLARVLEG